MNETTNLQHETEFVFRRLTEAVHIGGKEYDARLWLAILIPILLLGLVYVVWMYVRDGRSVGWPWASFLGLLRCTVYVILAVLFLLPAMQAWETSRTQSKVILLLDVSGSMGSKDDIPTEAMPVDKLLSRQDKVIDFLTSTQIAFLQKLQKKNPVSVYRFGSVVDEEFKVLEEDTTLTKSEWTAWLKPDARQEVPEGLDEEEKAKARKKVELYALLVNGTNLGDALLSVINREANNMLQGILVVSDGRSSQFSTQTFEEVRARAAKSKVPIFTVGIGEHREPINIRITEMLAPEQTPPDEKFPVKLDIDGEGLADQEVTATLDIYKPDSDRPIEMKATARFKPGEPPHAQVEFLLDPALLPADLRKTESTSGKPELLEGRWKFVARIPKDKREVFLGKEHVSDPEFVHIIKKPLRVLLFAGAPTRDYQFARTLFVREVDAKRVELSIYLQLAKPDIVQDVPAERLLRSFPTAIRKEDDPTEKPEDKYLNLLQYDVIVAFDPDWTQLQPEQLTLLENWVAQYSGGLILVGGPVNTFQLTRGQNQNVLKPILDLYPVILEDNRIQGLDRSTSEPWRLNFPGATTETEFLKLDDESKDPLSGWEEFFTGRKLNEVGREMPLKRGFFDYYPVREVKPSATVVATFTDPRARMKDGKEQPYIVTMPYSSGKIIYLGSGEIWRLRQFREAFHERFWTKLTRFVASTGQASRKRGSFYMGKNFTANNFVRLEARLRGTDMKPLPKEAKPKVQFVKVPPGVAVPPPFELQAKPTQGGEWEGWFAGRFLVHAPGNYEIKLATDDEISSKFTVKEANPELDNTRPDFAQLRQLASEADDVQVAGNTVPGVLRRLNDETRARLRPQLERTNRAVVREGDDKLHLYFDLKAAELIPDCMETEFRTQKNRGKVEDLWDFGFTFGDPPLKVSTALLVVVALLSIEWLTRKLLKLA